jgi:hypothetical protein
MRTPPEVNYQPPDWHKYRGNNYIPVVDDGLQYGGSVSFKQHLNKPLSNALWEDLLYRLKIRGLCIYGYNMSQWCVGWGSKHCIIILDEYENVNDIRFTP